MLLPALAKAKQKAHSINASATTPSHVGRKIRRQQRQNAFTYLTRTRRGRHVVPIASTLFEQHEYPLPRAQGHAADLERWDNWCGATVSDYDQPPMPVRAHVGYNHKPELSLRNAPVFITDSGTRAEANKKLSVQPRERSSAPDVGRSASRRLSVASRRQSELRAASSPQHPQHGRFADGHVFIKRHGITIPARSRSRGVGLGWGDCRARPRRDIPL